MQITSLNHDRISAESWMKEAVSMTSNLRDKHEAGVLIADPFAEIEPRTEIFAKLLECRRALVASGSPLLSDEEIEGEKAERRGDYYVGGRDEDDQHTAGTRLRR